MLEVWGLPGCKREYRTLRMLRDDWLGLEGIEPSLLAPKARALPLSYNPEKRWGLKKQRSRNRWRISRSTT